MTQIIENILNGYISKPVPIWAKTLNESDFPHNYEITFAGIVVVTITLLFPFPIAKYFCNYLTKAILQDDDRDFIMNKYLPELKPKVENINLPLEIWINIVKMFTGTIIKIVYAFLYQEKYLKVPGFDSKIMIELGGAGISLMNGFADSLTGFTQSDENVNRSYGVYPGED
jgi:hypothetical protein